MPVSAMKPPEDDQRIMIDSMPANPIEAWVAEARVFADVFPESNRLSSRYFEGAGEDWPTLASALVEWGVAVPAPLVVEEEFDLKSELVPKIACGPLPASLASDKPLLCKQVSRIPLLGDVIGRIELFAASGVFNRHSPGKGSFRGVACSPEAKPVPSAGAERTMDPNRLKHLRREVVRPIRGLEAESQNGNPG